MPYLLPQKGVNTDYFTDYNASGGDGGSPFTFIKLDTGAALKRIQTWKENWRFRGVEVWMTDDSSLLVGNRSGDSDVFSFESGELITRLKIQASGELSNDGKHRLGAIAFETNHNRKWEINSNYLKEDGEYWPNVGSGICCGIFGAAGWDVDRLGFAMLRKIQGTILTNLSYPNLALEVVATTPETLASNQFSNGTELEQTFDMSASKTVTTTREWSSSTTMSLTIDVEVQAGIPEVVEVDAKTIWTVSTTGSHSRSTTTSETKSWNWPLVCPPKTRILGEATMYADTISTAYDADLELHLDNGKLYRYKETGIYKGINVRSGNITVKDLGPVPNLL